MTLAQIIACIPIMVKQLPVTYSFIYNFWKSVFDGSLFKKGGLKGFNSEYLSYVTVTIIATLKCLGLSLAVSTMSPQLKKSLNEAGISDSMLNRFFGQAENGTLTAKGVQDELDKKGSSGGTQNTITNNSILPILAIYYLIS